MKRATLYCRVSTVDQHPETQFGELRQFAGFQTAAGLRTMTKSLRFGTTALPLCEHRSRGKAASREQASQTVEATQRQMGLLHEIKQSRTELYGPNHLPKNLVC
jgi:hypothetical protein